MSCEFKSRRSYHTPPKTEQDWINIHMDIKTETLIILMEECGEVIQECSKILRFGNDSEKLHKELGDLFCMIKLTENNLELDFEDTYSYSDDKYKKLQSWSKIVKPVK